MKKEFSLILSAFVAFLMVACQSQPKDPKAETERLHTWLDQTFDEGVDRSPIYQSYLGIKKDYDKWGDNSEARMQKELQITKDELAHLRANFNIEDLDPQGKISYRLFEESCKENIETFKYRNHNYPVNQMHGTHSFIASFMINIHRVANDTDALAYLTRLETADTVISQLITNLTIREEAGIIAPKFVFPLVLDDCKNIISGAPYQPEAAPNAIYADLQKKMNSVPGWSDSMKSAMIERGEKALLNVLKPAYLELIDYLTQLETKATEDAGVWKFPEGEAYYLARLKEITTTDMTPNEIFETGQAEVKRIHAEMTKIKEKVGFEGDLKAFFKHIETDPQFYYTNDAEGKEAYLNKTHAVIDSMRNRLDDLFYTKPKAELVVKRVEEFREKTAGKAFYQTGSPDFSRPGTYYVNLYDMTQMPKNQMEALAYHEGIPGHHMQRSINQELQGLPKYRTLAGGYTAFVEGWGLYSEKIPKEIGFYSDPYSDFGRLSMELWRACRLVADVGIHSKKWTREKAIEFYSENTPNPYDDCVKMVERHIVMAGQATAYKVGQLKILALRKKAKEALGEKFDIREFHDVVLTNGEVPLGVLEELVDKYIASK